MTGVAILHEMYEFVLLHGTVWSGCDSFGIVKKDSCKHRDLPFEIIIKNPIWLAAFRLYLSTFPRENQRQRPDSQNTII